MKKIITLLLLIVLPMSIVGCAKTNTPPTLEEAEDFFEKYNDEIMNIVDFMISSEYESIQIKSGKGKMWADFSDYDIEDKTVKEDVAKLFRNNSDLHFYMDDGEVFIRFWIGFGGISTGFSYSINENHEPVSEFQTSVELMSKEGWYYYVDDYEQWRIKQ